MVDILKRNCVTVLGEADKPLLFVHGFGCNQSMWDAITPAFTQSHRQILFDYVGSGQSDLSAWNKDRYGSLHGFAQDIIDVCDALELTEGVTVIGHSVSATTAMLASIQRPELFDKMVLLGPTPCFLNFPPEYMGGFDRADLEGLLELMDSNYLGWASHLAPVVAGGAPNQATAVQLQDSFCSTDPVAAKAFAKATFFADNRQDLAKVKTPCLILQHGRDDLVPLEIGNYLHEQLENSELKVIDVAGHCAHMTNPDLVIEAMTQFL